MSLFRAFATVGGLTMVSRVLGFVRDILIAAILGTGLVADSFFVAFRFPNLFRRLFGEGAFNAAFVPLFTKHLATTGKSEARLFAEDVASVLMTVLIFITAIAELAMPWLVYLIAPGFADDPEKFSLSVVLTRITFPYLFCMSLVALLSGLLNALNKFALAAAAPILLNLVLIAVMGLAGLMGLEESHAAGILLSWGVAIAGALQLIVLALFVMREGYGFALKWPRMTSGVRRFFALSIPGIIAGGITQINIMIGTIIASMQDGAVSYLYYADRIYQLPLGIVGIAIGVVLLPTLSRQMRSGDIAGAIATQNRSCEFSSLLTLPAAVAIFIIAEPIIRVLFERGVFTYASSQSTAIALQAFAVGLPAFVLIKLFSPGFFANEDTKTPMHYAAISVAVNVALSIILFFQIGFVGIAIATSVAAWVNALLLVRTLIRRRLFRVDSQLKQNFVLTIIASAMMGFTLYWLNQFLPDYYDPINGLMIRASLLAALVMAGLLVYGLSAQLMGLIDMRSLKQQVKRQR